MVLLSENNKNKIKVSVRNIIEFTMRSGDLESGFTGSSRAVEGTRAHQKVQRSRDKEKYESEVTLSHSVEYDAFSITISGRADGIISDGDNVIVDEIKSTNKDLDIIEEEYDPLHWGQAMFYAYFYALDHDLETIGVQLTYFQLETEKIKEFKRIYTLKELANFFEEVVVKYLFWADFSQSWFKERDYSIKQLEFPFSTYRKGQRKLAVSVYKTIMDEKKLYVQAPTGIGKTISTIFPSIKAMVQGQIEKIFYLTARTVTRGVAEENLLLLYNKNLKFKSITLTAKDKICFQEESNCNPDFCPYARGHYDRVNEALKDILEKEDLISREKVEEYAKIHRVCPFEFSLDIALWVDMVICDYNYVFDPRVGLKRFFSEEAGNYIFLIDEAHNLVDRGRDMYSAGLYLDDFLILKEILTEYGDLINKGLKGNSFYSFLAYLDKLIDLIKSYYKQLSKENNYVQKEEPMEYRPILTGFINRAEELLLINQKGRNKKISNNIIKGSPEYNFEDIIEILLNQYFNVLSFMRIMDIYDKNFVVYYQQGERPVQLDTRRNLENANNKRENNNFVVKLFCLDPHGQLKDILRKGKAAVFFSATLTPLTYHRQILGGSEGDYMLELESPFDSNNLCLMAAPAVSTKYNRRDNSYETIADYIAEAAISKGGNYLSFFPSYAYMSAVHEYFIKKYPKFNTIIQSRSMNEKERDRYINRFNLEKSIVGFAVLGGIFSEGVDLKGDRLLGSIVVGVGHPRICLERNLIRSFFQEKGDMGYEFAYLYPGMNKVLQAAGRTIRTENDRGIIFLIGERFNNYRYRTLMPTWWHHNMQTVRTEQEIKRVLKSFW